MKKLIYLLFVSLLAMQACKSKENKELSNTSTEKKEPEGISKKGAWSANLKEEFIKGCESQIMQLKDSPDGKTIQAAGVDIQNFAQKACNCALNKAEQNYENPIVAGKDTQGISKITETCGREIMLQLLKK